MKLRDFFLCLCVVILSTGPVSSASDSHLVVDPNEAKKILTLNVLSTNMQMSMGQITSILDEQGYTVKYGWSDCLVREGSIMFAFSYPQ